MHLSYQLQYVIVDDANILHMEYLFLPTNLKLFPHCVF